MTGDLPDARRCASDGGCQSGTCAHFSHSACGSCFTNCEGCPEGSKCEPFEYGYSCSLAVEEGDMCFSTSQCELGSHCQDQLCTPKGAEGEACRPGDPDSCQQPFYAGAFLYCEPETLLCTRNPLVKAGASCSGSGDGGAVCGHGSWCDLASADSTCIATVADGSPCDLSHARNCLLPAACIDGFCQFRTFACDPD
jgi:hypothetical protein